MGLPQMDRRERAFLEKDGSPFPRQFQAREQGARPGRTAAQTWPGTDVLLDIDRRQESVQAHAVRQSCEHGQDALPRFQQAVQIVPGRVVDDAGVHVPRGVIEQRQAGPEEFDDIDLVCGSNAVPSNSGWPRANTSWPSCGRASSHMEVIASVVR